MGFKNIPKLNNQKLYKHYVILRNMEIVGRISKGSRMDQIYLPKNRENFNVGSYVSIKTLEIDLTEQKIKQLKPYFYNINYIEPIKLQIISQITEIINKSIENENILITGSFLEQGFNFKDIDIIIISEKNNEKQIEKAIEDKIKIKTHIIIIDNKTLLKGLSTDPLYQMMLSRCIAKKRFIYKTKHEINYKILDLHLLKSKLLIDNFDILNGNEKYNLTRNLITISLYSSNRKVTKESVDKEIKKQLADTEEIKQNILNKTDFIRKYKALYDKLFEKIMEGIKKENKDKTNNKNASKQKSIN